MGDVYSATGKDHRVLALIGRSQFSIGRLLSMIHVIGSDRRMTSRPLLDPVWGRILVRHWAQELFDAFPLAYGSLYRKHPRFRFAPKSRSDISASTSLHQTGDHQTAMPRRSSWTPSRNRSGGVSLSFKSLACEFQCAAVLCHCTHDLIGCATRNFCLDLQCDLDG